MSYFSNVFLCSSDDKKNFKCKEFKSFQEALEANKYYERNFNAPFYKHTNHKSTVVLMCKFIPTKLQEYFINKKLEKIYGSNLGTKITKNVINFNAPFYKHTNHKSTVVLMCNLYQQKM